MNVRIVYDERSGELPPDNRPSGSMPMRRPPPKSPPSVAVHAPNMPAQNNRANLTPRKQLERELGVNNRPSIASVRIIKGERFKEWLKEEKFDALLDNLGMNRPDVNGAPFCSGMIDGMKTWLKSIKKGVDRWVSKMRYAVIVYQKEHAVSALFCTVDGRPPATSPVVTIEYICTNKGHGMPLMKYAGSDANLRKASHVTLHSMIHAIPFYAKIGYTRGPNACDLPLTRKERDAAHVAWKAFVAKYKKREIARCEDLENAKKSLAEAQLALDTSIQGGKEKAIKKATDTKITRQARVDKITWELGVLEERLSRFSNPDDWRGKRRDGTYMYNVPVLFSNDEKYPLPVFSKCLLTNVNLLRHRTRKIKSGSMRQKR